MTVTPTPDNSNDNSNTSQNVNYSLWRMLSDSNDNQRRNSSSQREESVDWINKAQIVMESYGLSNSSKEELIKYAAKSDVSINSLKYVRYVKVAGKLLVVGGVAITGYQAYDDISKGNYYSAGARTAVLGIGFAATAIPIAGWAVAGGIGLADAICGDQFYNWVELNLRK